jgi:hypothetical protein
MHLLKFLVTLVFLSVTGTVAYPVRLPDSRIIFILLQKDLTSAVF